MVTLVLLIRKARNKIIVFKVCLITIYKVFNCCLNYRFL